MLHLFYQYCVWFVKYSRLQQLSDAKTEYRFFCLYHNMRGLQNVIFQIGHACRFMTRLAPLWISYQHMLLQQPLLYNNNWLKRNSKLYVTQISLDKGLE